ncbi:MAG: hypothetical protein PWQ06_2770 [Anaerophaga sp.]|nr:hypothetical protein [Anaerophaga sp.]
MRKYVFLILIPFSQSIFASIRTYSYPEEIKASDSYTLTVDGIPVHVIDNPVPCSFAAFEMELAVSVEIESKVTVKWVDVRPLNAGIKPVIKEDKIYFTITEPGNYSVEINGKLSHPLFIFPRSGLPKASLKLKWDWYIHREAEIIMPVYGPMTS